VSGPHLHEEFPVLGESLPFVRLGTPPTPVRQLHELGAKTELWLKDESPYGDGGWGGNKVRKLEWLIPDALRLGRKTIFTVGGIGTNWGLATALYAREHGLRTALALVDQPVDDHVRAQLARLEASGATIHRTRTKARTIAEAPFLLARHTCGLTPPYYLPAGGSSPVGSLGYVEAAFELAAQVRAGELPEPSHIVCAVGSGGTIAGLLLGLQLAGLKTRAFGVVVNDAIKLDPATLARLASRTADVMRDRGAELPPVSLTPADFDAPTDWLGAGYGHATPVGNIALKLARERADLPLEPVYTAKALAAALTLEVEGPVLFLNTNGPR
jgi:D-cysteine desulfhydrase